VIRAEREMLDIDPPPWFRRVMGSAGRIDRWQTAIWAAPSINVTDTAVAPAGKGRGAAAIGRILHLLTPETPRSTHYFWSVSRNYVVGDTAMSEAIRTAICATFAEDKAILEAQQRGMDESGLSVPQLAIKVDDAPLRARRLLAARLRREAAGEVELAPFTMPGDPGRPIREPPR
jgi:vanillate O-demethylase monooxygenase subunit